MGRSMRDRRLLKKRDTPMKQTLKRQDKNRKLLPSKRYDALPEEPEVDEHKPTIQKTSPVLHQSSPPIIHNPRCKSSATPANGKYGYQVSHAGQVTPIPKVIKDDPNLEKETPKRITSSSIDQETTSSCDDDDDDDEEEEEEEEEEEGDEDGYSPVSSSSSSLPSPEVFRREVKVETWTLPFQEELLDVHLHIKNSTLLDVSRAETICMHQPPNLSAIIDASTILPENNFDSSQQSEPETKTKTDSFKSDKILKTPSKFTKGKPILCKKKVWFKSPVVAETFKTNFKITTKLCTSDMKPDVNTPGARDISFKEESLPLKVEIKMPVETNPESIKFFDFIDEKEQDAYFQKMKERCVKLRSAALFPLTAAMHTNT